MILIVTNKSDAHADAVIKTLNERSVSVFRLNTEDFASRYSIALRADSSGGWGGSIGDEFGRVMDLASLRVGWLRRPNFDFFADGAFDEGVEEFVVSEIKAAISTLYAMPSVTWINNKFRSDAARTKFNQLVMAARLGVRIPKTIITTDPKEARRFVQSVEGEVVAKAVLTGGVTRNGISQGLPTRKINLSDLDEFGELMSVAPTQLQEYVPKAYELRVTVIGNKVFGARIDSQVHDETKIDWRRHTFLNPHSKFDLPEPICCFCRDFLREDGLLFGAFDFIVTPDGEYVFLENNPSGQFLWLEHETGLPLTEAVCDLLTSLDRQDAPSSTPVTLSPISEP